MGNGGRGVCRTMSLSCISMDLLSVMSERVRVRVISNGRGLLSVKCPSALVLD